MRPLAPMGVWVCVIVLVAMLNAEGQPLEPIAPEDGGETRFHGIPLRDEYEVVVEQYKGGICRIGLMHRNRQEGGSLETGHVLDMCYLAETRCEVLHPTGANQFQSPGAYYRITVKGIEIEQGYEYSREVVAEEARDTLRTGLRELWTRVDGIEQEALYWSVTLVTAAYKISRLIPAPIFTSVESGYSGGVRIESGLRDVRLPAGRRLGPAAGFRDVEPLTGRALVLEETREAQAGAPSARAGGASYEESRPRAGSIKPPYQAGGLPSGYQLGGPSRQSIGRLPGYDK